MENTSMPEAPASLIGSRTGEVTSHVFHGREAAAQARSSGHRWEWSPGASSGRFVSSYRRAPSEAIVVHKQREPRFGRVRSLVRPRGSSIPRARNATLSKSCHSPVRAWRETPAARLCQQSAMERAFSALRQGRKTSAAHAPEDPPDKAEASTRFG